MRYVISFNPSSLDCTYESSILFVVIFSIFRFNPSSLDCTYESTDVVRHSVQEKVFQSFFSGLYL